MGLEAQEAGDWAECLRRLQGAKVRALVVRSEGQQRQLRESIVQSRQEAPLTEVLVWAPDGTGEDVRLALQDGAADVILSRSATALAKVVRRVVDQQRLLPRIQRFQLARSRSSRFEGLVSRSPRMWELFETVTKVAPSGASVLVLGETGVGKELLARALHKFSGRDGRFVAVNCGAIPENLIDSELFGHEEGTFTGATSSKQGLFRSADGGSLFLDEVGNLPLGSQFSLLRALQEGAVRPVGGETEIPVDTRVIAATSLGLDEQVERGFFREDLLFRLDVVRLVIPPLRERPEDVLHLFGYFRRKLTRQYGLEMPAPADSFLEALLAYDWPGNVRELENLTERLVLTHHGKRITARQFEQLKRPYRGSQRAESGLGPTPAAPSPPSPARSPLPAPPEPEPEVDLRLGLSAAVARVSEEAEVRYLRAALHEARGSVQDTARIAGISPRTLLRKLRKHGIDKREFKLRGVDGPA